LPRTPNSESEPDTGRSSTLESAIRELTSLTGVSALLVVDEKGEIRNQWYRTLLDRSKLNVAGVDINELTKAAMNFIGRIGGVMLDSIIFNSDVDSVLTAALRGVVLTSNNMILNSDVNTVLIQSAGSSTVFILADKRANIAILAMKAKRVASIVASERTT
jgi:predicted regulator of Ras-like GTPase activity (Roadblock/LC7/MglB family)